MNQEKVLILGASGYVGSSIYHQLSKHYEVYGTYHSSNRDNEDDHFFHMDIQTNEIESLLETIQPDVILSSLRGEFDQQTRLHRRIADYVASDSKRKMIFISTANVFDGDLSKPHYESEETNPQSDYGTYKANCEKLLQDHLGHQCIILRIPAVWGVDCPRLNQLRTAKQLDSVTNFNINITTNRQIAEVVEFILDEDRKGIFHIGTTDQMDYFQLQKMICRQLQIKEPEFQIEKEDETCNQVLFSERSDLPEQLKQTISDVIDSMIHS